MWNIQRELTSVSVAEQRSQNSSLTKSLMALFMNDHLSLGFYISTEEFCLGEWEEIFILSNVGSHVVVEDKSPIKWRSQDTSRDVMYNHVEVKTRDVTYNYVMVEQGSMFCPVHLLLRSPSWLMVRCKESEKELCCQFQLEDNLASLCGESRGNSQLFLNFQYRRWSVAEQLCSSTDDVEVRRCQTSELSVLGAGQKCDLWHTTCILLRMWKSKEDLCRLRKLKDYESWYPC